MKVLRFLAVFLTVSVVVTVAAITASFVFWSFLPVQPGTVTALVTLFLVAPGIGIAAGIWMAIKAGQQKPGGRFPGSAPAWLPVAPPLAGAGLAIVLVMLVILPGTPRAKGRGG